MPPPSTRRKFHENARLKLKTNKVIARLTYCPKKHKQKSVRELRQKLQNKTMPKETKTDTPHTKLKFGSFNVNGLGFDTCWSIQQLLTTRGFDARYLLKEFYSTLIQTCNYYQVLALSETFQRADQQPTAVDVPGYQIWRTEHNGQEKGGGGLAMLYKNSLTNHHWDPSVPAGMQYIANERQWLQIKARQRSVHSCTFIQCVSPSQIPSYSGTRIFSILPHRKPSP